MTLSTLHGLVVWHDPLSTLSNQVHMLLVLAIPHLTNMVTSIFGINYPCGTTIHSTILIWLKVLTPSISLHQLPYTLELTQSLQVLPTTLYSWIPWRNTILYLLKDILTLLLPLSNSLELHVIDRVFANYKRWCKGTLQPYYSTHTIHTYQNYLPLYKHSLAHILMKGFHNHTFQEVTKNIDSSYKNCSHL